MSRYALAVTIVLASWVTTASSAIECRAELPPAAKEYWSWRIIDGKRCWYPGRPGLSKSNLHWPLSEPEHPSAPDALPEPAPRAQEAAEDARNAHQPDVQDLTFAERWRGLYP